MGGYNYNDCIHPFAFNSLPISHLYLLALQNNELHFDSIFVYHALGIPQDTHYLVEKRPFYTTPDGLGKAEMDLFS